MITDIDCYVWVFFWCRLSIPRSLGGARMTAVDAMRLTVHQKTCRINEYPCTH